MKLEPKHKAAIRVKLSALPPEERQDIIGSMRSAGNVPAELIAFVESVNMQLRMTEEREKSANVRRTNPPASAHAGITADDTRVIVRAAGKAGVFVTVFGGLVAAFAFVVIPAIISVGTIVAAAAPYIAGAAALAFGLISFSRSVFSKTVTETREPEILVRTTTKTETFRL